MSALQALEFVNEEILRSGVPVTSLVPILLDGAESLAMPGLVVGTLVRHLETSGDALFPFIVEPMVWDLEFARSIQEQSSFLAAKVAGLAGLDRRAWSLREACMMLTLQAQGERIPRLKRLGEQLLEAGKRQIGDDSSQSAREHLAAVSNRASTLDRNAYEVTEHEGQYLIQQATDPEVEAILGETNVEMQRSNEALGLTLRHVYERDGRRASPEMTSEILAADLETARQLVANPPSIGVGTSPDGPVAVAASAIEHHFTRGLQVADTDLVWSTKVVLDVAASVAERSIDPFDDSLFPQGVDRSAARAMPYLLLPSARPLRHSLGIDPEESPSVLIEHCRAIAIAASNEARLALARSFDDLWSAPCSSDLDGRCHHQVAFDVVEVTVRDCMLGPWDNERQERPMLPLEAPIIPSLAASSGDVIVRRLSPALRAFGSAAISNACCREETKSALDILLAAHRRGMLAYKHAYWHSDSDALVAARSALWQATAQRDEPLIDHVAGYLGNSRLLAEALRGINAAAEEGPKSAEAARRVWPILMDTILNAAAKNPALFAERHWGDYALSDLIPNPAYAPGYLTSELVADPIRWRDLLAWSEQLERWLTDATGRKSIDALVVGVGELEPADQVSVGLPWIEQIVQSSAEQCANTYTLPEWLHERREHLSTAEQRARWQRVVDLLLLAGDHRVADLAD